MDHLKPIQHWFVQRITGVAILLGSLFWMIFLGYSAHTYAELIHCLHNPLILALITLSFAGLLIHAYLGLQVICQDYISCSCHRRMTLFFIGGSFVFMFHWLVFCLVKIMGLPL